VAWLLREIARSRSARVPQLPTLTQARYHAGPDWGDVLRVAGMEPPPPVERGDAMRGLSPVEAPDLCLEVFGVLASVKQAERFARANDLRFAYARPLPARTSGWPSSSSNGTHAAWTPRSSRLRVISSPTTASASTPERIPEHYRVPALRGHTPGRSRASLDGFLDQLPSGLLPVRELYREYVRRNLDATHEP
jgi:hypothetical protein